MSLPNRVGRRREQVGESIEISRVDGIRASVLRDKVSRHLEYGNRVSFLCVVVNCVSEGKLCNTKPYQLPHPSSAPLTPIPPTHAAAGLWRVGIKNPPGVRVECARRDRVWDTCQGSRLHILIDSAVAVCLESVLRG